MTQALSSSKQVPEQADESKSSSWTIQRIVFTSAGVLGGIIALIFVIGILLGFTNEFEITAVRIEYIRNLFFIALTMEGILIIGSLAVLIVQISRLVNMLKRDVQPIISTAQETVSTAKGTVEFVGDNAVGPIIKAGGFVAGLGVIIRDVGGIRRAIRRTKQNGSNHERA